MIRSSFLSYIIFWSLRIDAAGAVTAQRHLASGIQWTFCNRHNLCYQLRADNAEIGTLRHQYFAYPVEIQVFRRTASEQLLYLRSLRAREGYWNYEKNQWILLIPRANSTDQEYIFSPETLKN
jgi:hypothetical protein